MALRRAADALSLVVVLTLTVSGCGQAAPKTQPSPYRSTSDLVDAKVHSCLYDPRSGQLELQVVFSISDSFASSVPAAQPALFDFQDAGILTTPATPEKSLPVAYDSVNGVPRATTEITATVSAPLPDEVLVGDLRLSYRDPVAIPGLLDPGVTGSRYLMDLGSVEVEGVRSDEQALRVGLRISPSQLTEGALSTGSAEATLSYVGGSQPGASTYNAEGPETLEEISFLLAQPLPAMVALRIPSWGVLFTSPVSISNLREACAAP